jgi:ubiquinone/menaquinone biosynthesis C-methylase UbiE
MEDNWHFNLIAPFYERFIGPPDIGRLKDLLALPSSGWMLDAGCGTGRVAEALRPFVDGLVVCDISFAMLAQSRRKYSKKTEPSPLPAQSSVTCLPFASGQFDRILVRDAFHHFSDQSSALRELARVLAPGGRLAIEEPDIRSFSVKTMAFLEKLFFMHSSFRRGDEIARLAATTGLRTWVEASNATIWVVAEKVNDE